MNRASSVTVGATLIVYLSLSQAAAPSSCEMIDDPAGYRYLECDPARIQAAKDAAAAAAKANEGKPRAKAGWEETVEEFAARMAVENAKTEAERAAAKAKADVVRREEESRRAAQQKQRASAAARAEEDFARAVSAGSVGPWRYARTDDRMDGGQIRQATTLSTNEISFGFPYQGRQRARLTLRSHPRYGRDVILGIEKGQFLCHMDDCSLTVRFGAGKPQRFQANRPDSLSTTIIFIRGHDRFVSALRKADKVLIEAPFYQEGNRILEFDVRSLTWPFTSN